MRGLDGIAGGSTLIGQSVAETLVGYGCNVVIADINLPDGEAAAKARQQEFEARVKELVESLPDLAGLVKPLLIVLRTLREQIVVLHRRLLAIVRDDEVC